MMKKTSIYLSPRETARLERLERAEGRPKAAIIRDAIASYNGPTAPDREFALDGIGLGSGDSVSDHTDAELLRGFAEDAPG